MRAGPPSHHRCPPMFPSCRPRSKRGTEKLAGPVRVAKREGLTVIRLKGSPFDMGYASGKLLQDQMKTLEDEFLVMIHSYVPQEWKLKIPQGLRHVPQPAAERLCFAGGSAPKFTGQPPAARTRIQNWEFTTTACSSVHHAAHDISYMMIDNPLISKAGCTALAPGQRDSEWPPHHRTQLRLEAAEVFSRDRIVIMCEPDGGIPFISLSWASMAGVVSGMNRAGISVTISGAPSSPPGETATPVAMVARDVLQKATTLTNALDIIRSTRVFVSTLWLIGRKTGWMAKFVVVEKTRSHERSASPSGRF